MGDIFVGSTSVFICWGEPARLTHQKTITPQCTFYFRCLGRGDPAVYGGGVSHGVGDIFVGSASAFILLGQTSEINSPKNNYAPVHFLF